MSDLVLDPAVVLDVRVQRFLTLESKALDDLDYEAWLGMLDPAVRYRMPVRSTYLDHAHTGFSTSSYLLNEDLYSLRMRIKRLSTKHAWAEDPPSRNRHLVTNVVANRTERGIEATSSLLLVRSRLDISAVETLTAERHDVLVDGPDGLRLLDRTVLVDQTILGLSAITTFL